MLLSEEDMFSCVTEMAFEVYWRRFWTAPSVAAMVDTLLIAPWIRLTALLWLRSKTWPPAWAVAPLVPHENPVVPRPAEDSTSWKETLSVSLAPGPTWKVTFAPPVLAVPF